MSKKTKLNYEELNKRIDEVFFMNEGETCYDLVIDDDGTVRVCLEDSESNIFDYLPNMSERPEALQYLMGERDTFSD